MKRKFQNINIYLIGFFKYGIGPLLMLIVLIVLFPITNYLVSIIMLDSLSQMVALIFENSILIGIIPLMYYIGTRIGGMIYPEELKVIKYSDSHILFRNSLGFISYFLGLFIIFPQFYYNLMNLLNTLFYTDWAIDPVFGLMTFFLNFYLIIFWAIFIGAVLRIGIIFLIDYIFYRSQLTTIVMKFR